MIHSPRVLVIDGQPETEEVLKAVLEPRGFQIELQNRGTSQQDADLQQKPHLVVLHEESSAISTSRQGDSFQGIPRVIIGTISHSHCLRESDGSKQPDEQRLSQPFQYSELIQAIECLLDK